MHAVFKVDELVKLITENIISEEDRGDRSMAYFARTCKTIYPAVSAVLWRDLRDLVPVVRCFPLDALAIKRVDLQSFLYLTRPLCPADWSLVMKCCARVRTIGQPRREPFLEMITRGIMSINLDPSVLPILSLHRPVVSLFPNLRALGDPFSLMPLGNNTDITLLFGHTLKKLYISKIFVSGQVIPQCLPLLSQIPTLCPYLVNLSIDTQWPRSVSLADIVRSLHYLESFSYHRFLSISAFTALASLPQLRTLRILLAGIPPEGLSLTSLAPFPVLRDLEISVEDLTNIIRLLGSITFRRLQSFTLKIKRSPSCHDIRHFFTLMPSRISGLALKRFFFQPDRPLHSMNVIDYTGIESCIDASAVRSFLPFHNLTVITMNPEGWWFKLDDATLAELAEACPKLCSLQLGTNAILGGTNSGLSMYCLLPLVEHCPELAHLQIVIHAEADMRGGKHARHMEKLDGTRVNTKLTSITFGNSTIGNPADVAAFLFALFPNLVMVNERWYGWLSHTHKGAQQTEDRWEEVNDLLQMFPRLRKAKRALELGTDTKQRTAQVTDRNI